MSVNGYCDPKFIELREYFEESINSKFELGAAISIEIEGESVINLWGGYQDANRRRAWEEDTSVSYTHLRAHETGRNRVWRRGG